jgi:hypothetical protein
VARILKTESTLKGVVGQLQKESSILGRIWKYELILGAILATAGIAAGALYANWWTLGVGAALLFLGVSHRLKGGENKSDIGRFQGGAEGEARVSEELRMRLPDSYLILNDISVRSGSRSAQNDHIVLGPNGIFVIETKAYSGTLSGKAEDDYLEQVKEWQGKRTATKIKNPLPQNEYHLEIVCERMKEGGFATDDVVSVVVFTNPRVKLRIEGAQAPIVRPEFLPQAILERKSRYGYDEEWLLRLAEHFGVRP